MEFKAIIDAKARAPSDCAVVGIYENGDLGAAARNVDAHTGGLIRQLYAGGDFAAKPATLCCCRGRPERQRQRVLLVGIGRACRLRSQTISQGAAVERSSPRQDRRGQFRGVPGSGRGRRRGRAIPRPHGGRNLQRTGLPDSRPEDRARNRSRPSSAASAWPPRMRARSRRRPRASRSARQSAARWPCRAIWRTCRRTSARPPTSGSGQNAWPRNGRASRPR